MKRFKEDMDKYMSTRQHIFDGESDLFYFDFKYPMQALLRIAVKYRFNDDYPTRLHVASDFLVFLTDLLKTKYKVRTTVTGVFPGQVSAVKQALPPQAEFETIYK